MLPSLFLSWTIRLSPFPEIGLVLTGAAAKELTVMAEEDFLTLRASAHIGNAYLPQAQDQRHKESIAPGSRQEKSHLPFGLAGSGMRGERNIFYLRLRNTHPVGLARFYEPVQEILKITLETAETHPEAT